MHLRIWLCLIPLLPLACAAHKARRHASAPERRARLQRAVPRVYIKRVYRVADGQAEPGLYKLTLKAPADCDVTSSGWSKAFVPFVKKPEGDLPSDSQASRSIARLAAHLKSSARPLPAKFVNDGEDGTLVEGVDLLEGFYEPVFVSNGGAGVQLVGWYSTRESSSLPPVEKSVIQAAASANVEQLYELKLEHDSLAFRPVTAQVPTKQDRPVANPVREVIPVQHEEVPGKEEPTSNPSRGPTSADKLLGQFQSEWDQFLPPPWPGRALVPLQPDANGRGGAYLYYEGEPLQWNDGRWIPVEKPKKR